MRSKHGVVSLGLTLLCATAASAAPRPLSLEQRIEAQRAIEDFCWRHRIWPAANARPTKTGVSFTREGAWEYDPVSGKGIHLGVHSDKDLACRRRPDRSQLIRSPRRPGRFTSARIENPSIAGSWLPDPDLGAQM